MSSLQLPHEILCLIAQSISKSNEGCGPRLKLGPYALVNKAWQAAFEAEIYSTVWLRSPSESTIVLVGRHKQPEKKGGLTHDQLDRLITGPQPWRQARHAAIRHITYWISVPHWLADNVREREELHSYENALRRENDEAFSKGVEAMFEYLSSRSWADRSTFLSLSLVLQAENVYTADMQTEPGTFPIELDRNPLADYRAKLTKGTSLASVSCVRAVHFARVDCHAHGQQNGISVSAQIEILSACTDCHALVEAKLDGAYGTGGQAPHRAQKRNDMATVLPLLPRSIRKLSVEWRDEVSPHVYAAPTQPLNCVTVPFDTLSRALHITPSQLRELHLTELEVTSDFFRLREEERLSPCLWPHLEVLRLTLLPMATPNGQPLIYDHRNVKDNRQAALLTQWQELEKTQVGNGDTGLSIVPGFFDDLYANAGRAALRMPKLQRLCLSFQQEDDQQLELTTEGHGRVLQFVSIYGYSPSREVLQAWRVPEEKLTRRSEVLEARYECWPPLLWDE